MSLISIRDKYDPCYVAVYGELFHKYRSHKDVYCVQFEAVRSETGLNRVIRKIRITATD